MTAWVIVSDGIIQHIPEAIEALWIRGVGDERIWLEETVNIRRIHPSLIVHDAAHAIVQFSLTGITKIGLSNRPHSRARSAERQISLLIC